MVKVAGHRVSATEAQVRQSAYGFVPNHAGVAENLLEFGGSRRALTRRQISLASQVDRVEQQITDTAHLVRLARRKRLHRFGGVAASHSDSAADHRQVIELYGGVFREAL